MDGVLTLDIIERATLQTCQVEWVDVQSLHGNFIIGPGHCPLASLLRKRGVITYKIVDGDIMTSQATKGTVTVVGDRVTLILD
ncbi:MAG: hypothetical protein WCT20_03355 [Candidatus Babeliales bacterium]|jgi:hypothetical protein